MKPTTELHYRYALAFLAAGIVLLITLAYFDVPDLVEKFSFALTLSSLLLAVLAIFYTIISSTKQDMQLTRLTETNAEISSAAREVRLASDEIRDFARHAPKEFDAIGRKIDQITNARGQALHFYIFTLFFCLFYCSTHSSIAW